MNADELLEMAGDPRFISGIYNYCDRWCERCPMTARCMVYATEQKDIEDRGGPDKANEAFWEQVGDSLAAAGELIRRWAEENGADLEEAVKQSRQRTGRIPVNAAGRKLIRQARAYAFGAKEWFETRQNALQAKQDELISVDAMGLEGRDPEAEATAIRDAIDVIHWYQFQIAVKLQRALTRDPELDDDEDLQEIHEHDKAGSTKVALLGMDRSIAAWTLLYHSLPSEEDDILNFLVQLDRLRRAAEAAVPAARAFIRPGFDESPDAAPG